VKHGFQGVELAVPEVDTIETLSLQHQRPDSILGDVFLEQ
jgi:hypothetical protein